MRRLFLLFGSGLLLAAFALPALAASAPTKTATAPAGPAPLHQHWFAGSVTAVGSNSVTVGVLWTGPHDGTLNGQTLTVTVPANARINQGPRRRPIALASIQPNTLVSVLADGDSTAGFTAVRIHVYCNCHWVGGTVTTVGADSFGVQVSRTGPYDSVLNGQSVTIQVNADTVYLRGPHRGRIALSDLKAGEGVGVVFAASGFFKAPGFNPATATFTGKRVHLWPRHQVPPPSTDAGNAAQTAVG